jgi:cellulose synthase (UDP-forming)
MGRGKKFLVPVMSVSQRIQFAALGLAWLASLVFFWRWWLQSAHIVTWFGLFANSVMLAWTLLTPGVFFIHLARIARFDPAVALPVLRVAMVVTKAPSEPWEVVRRTLRAMLRQDMPYAYDVWLADEQPTAETRRWCEANGVRISSREGRVDYHNVDWPRRTRSKEGNLAFFYDTWGYREYDVVSQLDADHRPVGDYLREVLRPFADPRVGYVAAPSLDDANARVCWAARARFYKEAVFHGPYQAGGHYAIPPLCIGSHYAVRTQALQEMGGLGPELAEDFSTTFMMNAFGWDGVFSLDAEAHGDGPETFAAFVTQEFQWARSLANFALIYSPRFWKGLDRSKKVKLGFAESWYPLHALFMLAATLFPIIALITGTPWANVRLIDFFAHALVVSGVLLVSVFWVGHQRWRRPADAPTLSWEAALFILVRWPWVLWGVIQSLLGWLLHRQLGFKVTPKGLDDETPIAVRVLIPYLFISLLCAATAIIQGQPGRAQGYYYYCLVNAVVYLLVTGTVIALHLRENQAFDVSGAWRLARGPVLATAAVAAAVGRAVELRGVRAVSALIPPSVGTFVDRILNELSIRVTPERSGSTPVWIVVVSGVVLVIGATINASESRARRSGAPSPAKRFVDVLLIALAGIGSLVYVDLAIQWHKHGNISQDGFRAVLALGVLLGVVAVGRHELERPWRLRGKLVGTERPTVDFVRPPSPAKRPFSAVSTRPNVSLLDPFASPLRRKPRPLDWPAGAPERTFVAGEISWGPDNRPGFRLKALRSEDSEMIPEYARIVESSHDSPFPRSSEVSRVHALLYDQLVLEGWEPCGRGSGWYAHRFRRPRFPEQRTPALSEPAR